MKKTKQKFYLVANWKMNPITQKKSTSLALDIAQGISEKPNLDVVICPPDLYIGMVADIANNFYVGGQNCFWERNGAFTGQASAVMLTDAGCKYVILGHSEQRKLGETNKSVNKKVKAVLKTSLKPIIAIGEKSRSKADQGEIDVSLQEQLQKAFEGISAQKAKNTIIAYEPIWAIGTGSAASTDEVMAVRIFIKKLLSKMYSISIAQHVPLLYGGSTNSKNCTDFLKLSGMDGLLVGGASLNSKEFIKMFNQISDL